MNNEYILVGGVLVTAYLILDHVIFKKPAVEQQLVSGVNIDHTTTNYAPVITVSEAPSENGVNLKTLQSEVDPILGVDLASANQYPPETTNA